MSQNYEKAMYGRKLGMSRVFTEAGEVVPVTVLQVGPNVVHQVKTVENDGYRALQVGFGTQKPQRVSRSALKHLSKAEKGIPQVVGEIRLDGAPADKEYKVGDVITLEGTFGEGDLIDIAGTTIGRGFAGVIRRHRMAGFPATRGTHEYFRHGGSIGNRKFPGRVFKNKRMGGHMGVDRVTQQNLRVVSVRPEENLLLVEGSVPGARNGIVFVRSAAKNKKRGTAKKKQ